MIRVKLSTSRASGRRRSWFKRVTGLNKSAPQGGYQLIGTFLQADKMLEIPVGACVIEVKPTGSAKTDGKQAVVYRLDESGLVQVFEADWKTDFLAIRDEIEKLLGGVK